MRLRSDLFVSAYIRRVGSLGGVAVQRRRGSAEAGAIFIKIDHLNGVATLYAPAPQTLVDDPSRSFARAHQTETLPAGEIEEKLARELRFDSDLWLIEVEDRQGRHFLMEDELRV